MHSKHALVIALMAGGAMLLVVFGGLLSLALLENAEPYLNGWSEKRPEKTVNAAVPEFTTRVTEDSSQIIEISPSGESTRVVHTSDLNDPIADFSLFAVPQTQYSGKIYVQAVQDAEGGTLIVYPISVETGGMGPAVLNVTSSQATISPDQNRVAVINTSPASNIVAYDLVTGTTLTSWTLSANERLTEGGNYSRTYTGSGVRWTNNNCFDHAVWIDNVMEVRSFCITSI